MSRSKLNFFPLAFPLCCHCFRSSVWRLSSLRSASSDTYEKIGIDRHYVFALLMASLLGSYIDIPIGELAA